MLNDRIRFVYHALRCSAKADEPLEVVEIRGLAVILEDHLQEAEDDRSK